MTKGVDLSIKELVDFGKKSIFNVRSRININNNYHGSKISKIKGHGVDFDQIREYQFGDDVRSIDWKATAKLQKTYTRTYKEERQRVVLLLIDLSQSMYFGTKVAFKSVIAARFATLIGFLAINHDDRVGAIIYTDNNHIEIKPKAAKLGIQSLIRKLVNIYSEALKDLNVRKEANNNLYSSLLRINRSAKPGSLIFIISDFLEFDEKSQILTRQLSKHNDVVLNFIFDPLEKAPPKAGRYLVNDGNNHKELDVYDNKNRVLYKDFFTKKYNFLKSFAKHSRQQFIAISTTDDLAKIVKNKLLIFK